MKKISLDEMIMIADIFGYEIANIYDDENKVIGHWLKVPQTEFITTDLFDTDREWNCSIENITTY